MNNFCNILTRTRSPYLYLIRVCRLTYSYDPQGTLIARNVVITTFVGSLLTIQSEPSRCHHLHIDNKIAYRIKKYPRHTVQGIRYSLPQTKFRGYGGLLPSALYTHHNIDGCCRYDPRSKMRRPLAYYRCSFHYLSF